MGAGHTSIFDHLPEDILVEDVSQEIREITDEFTFGKEGRPSRNLEH